MLIADFTEQIYKRVMMNGLDQSNTTIGRESYVSAVFLGPFIHESSFLYIPATTEKVFPGLKMTLCQKIAWLYGLFKANPFPPPFSLVET